METYYVIHKLPEFPIIPKLSQKELETPFYIRFLNNKKRKR